MKSDGARNSLWIFFVVALGATSGCQKASYDFPPEPLYLVLIQPENGAGEVQEDAPIEAFFSRAPDPTTVTTATFRLVDEATDAPVPARVEAVEEEAGKPPTLYRLEPTEPLKLEAHAYRVELSRRIATPDGATLDLHASRMYYAAMIPARFTTAEEPGEEPGEEEPDEEPPHFYNYALWATNVQATSIELIWFPAVDTRTHWKDLTYEIYLGTEADPIELEHPLLETAPGAYQYSVGGLAPDTTYSFLIRAIDEARNKSYWDESYVVSYQTLSAGNTTELTILYTADVFGTLEPCG